MKNKNEEILEISHVSNRYRDSGAGFFSRSKMTRVLNDVRLEIPYPGDLTMKVCACCGKNIYIPEEITGYIYRRQHNAAVENTIIDYYCGWNCMRKTEREVERIYKKIGVPTPSFRVREDV